jgi:hypothetical protein
VRTLRSVSLASALTPAAFLEALDRRVAALTDERLPHRLRKTGIGGVRVARRGTRFVLSFRRRRRAVAPVICRGRVEVEGSGSRIRAEVRPSRQWLWFPAIGTLLFLVQLVLSPPAGRALVGYAVAIGVLWAVNLLAATMPVGCDPGAEAQAMEELLADAATGPPHP